jgi:hypothetical protein
MQSGLHPADFQAFSFIMGLQVSEVGMTSPPCMGLPIDAESLFLGDSRAKTRARNDLSGAKDSFAAAH